MRPDLRLTAPLLLAAVATLASTACAPGAPSAQPGPTAAVPIAASVPTAPALQSARKEAKLVAGPRRRLEETLAALQTGDRSAARAAFTAFDGDWNGIEVYVNFRSRDLYGEIESHYEADIEKGLEDGDPAAQLVPQLQAMIAKYDEAIRLSDTGTPLSPLFDDVATVRITRAPLRNVGPAVKAGDLAAAASQFASFKAAWPDARALLAARAGDTQAEIDGALSAADRAMAASPINAAEAGPAVERLFERYNFGLSLLNAAARNADVAKTAFTADDVRLSAGLGGLQRELRSSLAAWDSGNYTSAAEITRGASDRWFEAAVPALQSRSASDAAVKKALDGYLSLVGQPGDAAQVRAANKAAIEAVAVGQQVLVGQFWTDPEFIKAYQGALAAV
jgi:hypothetical protein